MDYAQRIKDLRTDNDKTQKETAQVLQTTQSYCSQYENRKREMPIHHLITLSKYYGVTTDYILGLTDIKNICL